MFQYIFLLVAHVMHLLTLSCVISFVKLTFVTVRTDSDHHDVNLAYKMNTLTMILSLSLSLFNPTVRILCQRNETKQTPHEDITYMKNRNFQRKCIYFCIISYFFVWEKQNKITESNANEYFSWWVLIHKTCLFDKKKMSQASQPPHHIYIYIHFVSFFHYIEI